jgi:hypothetical protein
MLYYDRFATPPGQPFIAPLHEAHDHRQQSLSLLGKPVTHTSPIFLIRQTQQNPPLDQPPQPSRENIGSDTERGLETVEGVDASGGVSNDQQRPPIADLIEASCDGAIQRFKPVSGHARSIPERGPEAKRNC